MIKKILCLFFFAAGVMAMPSLLLAQSGKPVSCEVTIKFIHLANRKKIEKADSIYTTPNGEPYTISKLKYYISEIRFKEKKDDFSLIDAFGENSIHFSVPEGNYKKFSFLLGVDSLHNCSGAQDGALDPLNDMFWTWNSGYVMFKLEGVSDSSHADLNRIEHHIGGYKGADKTMRTIMIDPGKEIIFSRGKNTTLLIAVDLDKYWKSVNTISIAATPVLVTPGKLAIRSADNFSSMFSLKEIIYGQ